MRIGDLLLKNSNFAFEMRYFAIYIALFILAGCAKSKLDADYIVRPWHQAADKGELDSLFTLVGFSFEVDTADWIVASYDDALIGRITHRTTGETRNDGIMAMKDTIDWSLTWFNFKTEPVMIIVADTKLPFYAYHQAVLYNGVPRMIFSIIEQSWRADITVAQNVWRTVYAYSAPEPEKPEKPIEPDNPTEPDDPVEPDVPNEPDEPI